MRVDRSRLPALGPERPFTFPEIRRQTLGSGLRVWTAEHRQVPLVSVLVLLPVGAAADPAGRPGLAAITADMLDEGCGDRSALDVHEALGRIGAQLDTDVGYDATLIGLTTLGRFLDQGLELVADMLIRPRLDQREFDRVRELRLNRLLQLRDMPPALADRVFAQLLYRNHPYGHMPIGTEGALRALTLRDITAFHRRAFRPADVTVVLAGDAPHETLADAAARAFGRWTETPGETAFDDPLGAEPPAPPPNRLALVHRAGAAQSELRIGHVAESRKTPDYHALLVLNMVLGGQFVSRVNMNLREEKGYTYGARTSFEFRRGPGPFVLQVGVQTGATARAIEESIGELTRGYPRSFETAEQIARAAAQLALYDLPHDYFSTFVPMVMALTPEDVTRAAATHLDPSRLLTVIVGDRERLTPSLASLEMGDASEVAVG
ncbi:MAG: hypothetical protein DMF85_14470 [Acidobacteria bacterium]|nr:MAG: hypothetical protein DMF85_14470 [Acidobacteriota bacterium]